MAAAAEEAGADAVSLVNTLKGMALHPRTRQPWLGGGTGGLSGPAIRAVALGQVASVAERVSIPVIGMGGIASGGDAAEFMAAGAAVIAVGTESFRDPAAGRADRRRAGVRLRASDAAPEGRPPCGITRISGTLANPREKACKGKPKTFIAVKPAKPQVEVQLNSPDFCRIGVNGPRSVCMIAADAGRPRNARQEPSAGLTPERSLTQRMDALQRANEIRTRRARLKRDLKAGRAKIHGLLLDPPEYLQTAKVFDLLLAVPKYGRVKVNRILTHCRISPSKTIGGLSERQRNELVSYLAAIAAALGAPHHPAGYARHRHHRALGRRQGHADPRAAGARPGAGAVGVGHHARRARARSTAATTTS